MTTNMNAFNKATQEIQAQAQKSAFNRGAKGVVDIMARFACCGLSREDIQKGL